MVLVLRVVPYRNGTNRFPLHRRIREPADRCNYPGSSHLDRYRRVLLSKHVTKCLVSFPRIYTVKLSVSPLFCPGKAIPESVTVFHFWLHPAGFPQGCGEQKSEHMTLGVGREQEIDRPSRDTSVGDANDKRLDFGTAGTTGGRQQNGSVSLGGGNTPTAYS